MRLNSVFYPMKLIMHLAVLVIVSGCSITIPSRALVANKTVSDVFGLVTQAITDSGYTIKSADEETGLIKANASGSRSISCTVQEIEGGFVAIDIKSKSPKPISLNEEDYLYGKSQLKDAKAKNEAEAGVKALLRKLAEYMPYAELTMNGKKFKP